MLDLYLLREQPDEVARRLELRGFSFDAGSYKALEAERKSLQTATQALQNERNQYSKAIGLAKARKEDITSLRSQVTQISEVLEEKKSRLTEVMGALDSLYVSLPNLPHSSVPKGSDEKDNKIIRQWGEPRSFDFPIQSHDALGEALGQMDFSVASKITGSRFVVLKSQLAKLHRALIQFMLDIHIETHGYEEIYVPYIVNAESLHGTGQLPKFEDDLFKLVGEAGYYLTSTAEIPVTNTVRNMILDSDTLPLRYVCHSPCFRSEAGSYGKDTKGMIRQHQFEKVELVWITKAQASYEALEQLTLDAESILQRLELPYRVMALCTGDLGFGAAKTYDLEVWLPSQKAYREISSCSNMEAFQARRMKARYRDPDTGDTVPVHTLNGSGLAIGRTLVAIMENYQDKAGHIIIPEALRAYMGNLQTIHT